MSRASKEPIYRPQRAQQIRGKMKKAIYLLWMVLLCGAFNAAFAELTPISLA